MIATNTEFNLWKLTIPQLLMNMVVLTDLVYKLFFMYTDCRIGYPACSCILWKRHTKRVRWGSRGGRWVFAVAGRPTRKRRNRRCHWWNAWQTDRRRKNFGRFILYDTRNNNINFNFKVSSMMVKAHVLNFQMTTMTESLRKYWTNSKTLMTNATSWA